jgi:hypothetical protein
MADRKISDLTALTTPASGDYLPIVDISEAAAASKNKRITIEELMRGVPDGTAAAPGIAFETDPNTGIYSPGADQLALSTAGNGRLFIDGNGLVGIGTVPAVGYGLDVRGLARLLNVGGASGLEIGTGTATNQFASLDLVGDATYTDYGLRLLRGNSGANAESNIAHKGTGALSLITEEAAPIVLATSNTERVRIDSSGNVGIGTASPGTILDVSFAGGMVRAGGVTGNNIIQAYTGSGSVGLGMWAGGAPRFYSTGNMIFSVNSTVGTSFPTGYVDAMTIDSSGRVGIGTSAPGYALDVAASDTTASTGYAVRIRANATAGAGALQFTDSGATAQYGLLVFGANGVGTLQADGASSRLVFGTNSTERLRIDSSGNVGIGTSSPDSTLQVIAGAVAGFRVGYNNTSVNYYDADTQIFRAIDGSERIRIDSSGRVGIGTSSPGSKLEIRNDVAATTSLDTTAIKLYNNLDGGSGIEFANAVAGKSKISFGVEGVGAGTNETYLGFSTCLEASALAEGMRLTSAGRVGIGTTSPTTLLDVNADTVRVRTARTPASATATGATGEICWDANYIYVCTATNTWKRSAISTW